METDSNQLLGQFIGAGVLWIVYSVVMLIMVKIQKMNVGFVGVAVSCLFGTAATLVPYVGIYGSFPVAVFVLWRFAGTHAFGDAIFTVVISGALMFCFKLFVLASLMGNISPFPFESDQVVDAAELETEMRIEPGDTQGKFDWSLVDEEAFALKGITSGARRQLVMFQYNDQIYTLEEGESCGVRTKAGTIRVKCVKVHRSNVELLLNDQEIFKLSVD